MIEKNNFNQLISYILVVGVFILAFLIVKPILYSIIYGILLAYIFYPFYKLSLLKLKNENLSAFLVCFVILTLLAIILSIILVTLLNQAINFYLYLQTVNFTEIINRILPSFISSEFSSTIANSINTSIPKILGKFVTSLGDFVLNIPNLFFQVLIVVLIFFFGLRDGEKAFEYFKSLSPFKRETQEKFFKHFEDITKSVLVGEIVIGILQGLVAGIGYFIFGVPNALLLTILTIIIGVLPIIGPWLIWIPADIYLFSIDKTVAGFGLLIYGLLLINWIDIIIRPLLVSRKTEINHAVVLIGMIGGLYIFGLIGLIIGPLILVYVLLILEVYRKQNLEQSIVFKKMKDYHLF